MKSGEGTGRVMPTKANLGDHFHHSLKFSSSSVLPKRTVHITARKEAGPGTGQVAFSAKANVKDQRKDLHNDSGVWGNRLTSLSSRSNRTREANQTTLQLTDFPKWVSCVDSCSRVPRATTPSLGYLNGVRQLSTGAWKDMASAPWEEEAVSSPSRIGFKEY